MQFTLEKNKYNQGFTLIEMALVMVIGGILLAFMGSALLTYVEKSRADKTEYRMDAIKIALSEYLSINRRYPCTARRDIGPGVAGTPAFGVEVSTQCTGNIAGTVRTNVADAQDQQVRIGSVPTRTLNLPDEMAIDGWGNRFTYAVTINQANLDPTPNVGTLYRNDGGVIRIADSTGTEFVTDAHYALISHGVSGIGSFNLAGNLTTPCRTGAADPLDERTNCDDDRSFTTTLIKVDANNNQFFDDVLYYQGQTAPALLIPAGAVMAFNLGACPDGWVEYDEAEGKFIIGGNNGVAPAPPASYSEFDVSIGAGSSSGNYPIELDAGDQVNIDLTLGREENQASRSGIPPYVALLYCEKLPD